MLFGGMLRGGGVRDKRRQEPGEQHPRRGIRGFARSLRRNGDNLRVRCLGEFNFKCITASSFAMREILLTAIFTTAIAAGLFGTLIHKLRLPANERLLWQSAAMALPLPPLAFYLVRVPLDHWLASHIGAASPAYPLLTTWYAPLTEEPAKLVPLLIPAICRDIRPANFARYALAIGLGFAIGEMWFIADRVAKAPAFAGIPFYQFGGYVSERLRRADMLKEEQSTIRIQS
jgi:hypothetical protein